MHHHAPGGAHDAIVEGEADAIDRNPRRRAGSQRGACRFFCRLAVARGDFVEVKTQISSRLCQTEKEIVERKIVQHQNSRVFDHRLENARVITMIITHVIDNGVKRIEALEQIRVLAVITNLEARSYLEIRWLKAVNKQGDVRYSREIRQ